ncbi:hypothetical protein JQS43_21765 [Natronosporangium hydrolyticum]|uniref:Uncharacterized protein n=1 Tax=Natronosporangium hydrolyticum TaxID=2811111 RepID=A0A895YJZ4_9ACTN|nr:hypothetical protein [Natronosporangium hydrolyticum]QSB14128.1 hypothetical protein JQS43_21765 [Natronosporangium hydrolyticum]
MIARVVTAAARISVTPLLLRAVIATAGFGALALAAPDLVWTLPVGWVLLAAVAIVPACLPSGVAPLLLVLVAAGGWVASASPSATVGFAAQAAALAGLLYLVHTVSALVVALPFDAVVAPDAVVAWLLRAAAVIAASAGLVGLVLLGVPYLAEAAGVVAARHVAATVVGVALAVLLTYLLRALRSSQRG